MAELERIGWVNNQTAINDTNLKALEDNVENFVEAVIEEEKTPTAITDADEATETGFYYLGGSATNVPSASAWFLVAMKQSTTNITQVAFRYRDNEMWIRHYNTVNSTGWKDWICVSSSNSYYAKLKLSSGTTVSAGSYTTVTFTDFETNLGEFSISSNVITVPTSGTYIIDFNAHFLNVGTSSRAFSNIYISNNSSADGELNLRSTDSQNISTDAYINNTHIVRLATNAKITFQVWSTNATTLITPSTTNPGTFATIKRISA